MKSPKNIPASIRQRLLNRAKNDRRPFNELLQYFAMERFLYRLTRSAHANRFVLKGALLLRTWNTSMLRPTMDIDMLGKTGNDLNNIIELIRATLTVNVEPDGISFDPESIQAERITEGAAYEGVRIWFMGALDSAKIKMRIDIGFGDVVYPEPEISELPVLLNFPAPQLLCYSKESFIAEKFEAMVKLGTLNSRMKDFYDIWLLSRQFDFEGAILAEAIRLTFEQRDTVIPEAVEAFSETFIDAKDNQWATFRKRLKQSYVPGSFKSIVTSIDGFLSPIFAANMSVMQSIPTYWTPPGPWK